MPRSSPSPRYIALAAVVRDQIESGRYAPGDRLPSEAELCASHGVSRGTVVRAIEQLVADGIVFRQQGAGSFVASPSLYRRSGQLLSFTETARAGGHTSRQKLVSYGPAAPEKARQFGCESPSLLLRRLRYIDGIACAIHTSLVPASVAHRVPHLSGDAAAQAALSNPQFSLYAAFDDVGLSVQEAEERVTTRLAEAAEMELLGLVRPAAVMVVFRCSYSAAGMLLEAVEAVYRSDFYAYDLHLVRGHPDQRGPKIEQKNRNLQPNRETQS